MEQTPNHLLFAAHKILLITAAHVGNVLFCLPAIHYLKKHYPEKQFDVVVLHKRALDIFDNNPMIHRVYLRQTRLGLRHLMKKYDLSICLNYVTTEKYLLPNKANLLSVPPSDPQQHRAEEVLQFVKSIVTQPINDEDRNYCLYPQTNDFVKMRKYTKAHPQKILVGIHLGSSRTQIHGWKFWYKKRAHDPRLWPLQHYIALAEQLRVSNPNIEFVLTGGKNERFLADIFIKQIPQTISLMGKTTLAELAALMSNLAVYVTHDTGALHVACATQVPIVSLFGHTDAKRSGPYPSLPQRMVLQASLVNETAPALVAEKVLQLAIDSPAVAS